MEIQFDLEGNPVGGRIFNYLLEKSRVVSPSQGERSFHVFYQVLAQNSPDLMLSKKAEDFEYLNKSECYQVPSIDDSKDGAIVRDALKVIGFAPDEIKNLFSIVAAILHIGN